MRIGKPLLLVTTPLGLAIGLEEAIRLTGGMALLFVAMTGFFGVGIATVVRTIRRERSS
jgi:hypothetical protein